MKNIQILFPEGRRKALTFSYDDGASCDRELLRILNGFGMRGSFNLNSGSFGKDYSDWCTPFGELITSLAPSEVKTLYQGHEIAIHGRNHAFWTAVPRERMLYEILQDKHELEQIAGYPVRGLAYPFFSYDPIVREIVTAAGIRYARTTERENYFQMPHDPLFFAPTCWHTDRDLMERAEKFLTEKFNTNAIFCLSGHSFEYAIDGNWHILEEFCKRTSRQDEIWYAPCIEIFDYLDGAKSLRWTSNCSIVQNPTAYQIFLEADGQTFSIGPGETLHL